MSSGQEGYTHYQPGIGTLSIAVIIGSMGSFALATVWLELSPNWVSLLVGAVCALLGALAGENIGDAIVFSVIVGLVVSVFIAYGPEIAAVRAGIVPAATGMCVGKLVMGISKEVAA